MVYHDTVIIFALRTGSGSVQLGGWLDHRPAWGQQCHDPVMIKPLVAIVGWALGTVVDK